MKRVLPPLLGISLILFFSAIVLNKFQTVSAATATHVVISEVQIEGATSSDEFVELYNPTSNSIDLTNWTLNRKTASAVATETIVATLSGSISSHGFYLIANTGFDGELTPDTSYSSENISSNNSVNIRNSQNDMIDLLGMGTSATSETTPLDNPIDNRSLERKASSNSLEADMGTGGTDELAGNGEDTNNNSVDFVRHVAPNVSSPQNSASAIEPVGAPSVTPSVTPSPTASPTPSETPSVTPSPTEEPSVTPTSTLTPSPTVTTSPSPSVTPSVSPTPPVPTPKVIFSGPSFTCSLNYRPLKFFNKIIYIPFAKCIHL